MIGTVPGISSAGGLKIQNMWRKAAKPLILRAGSMTHPGLEVMLRLRMIDALT